MDYYFEVVTVLHRSVSSDRVKYSHVYRAEVRALSGELMHSAEAASHPANGSFFTWHLGSLKIN